MGHSGQLTLDWERNQEGYYTTGIDYTVILYQKHNLTLQLDTSLNRQQTSIFNNNQQATIIPANQKERKIRLNRSIMLTLIYNFSSTQNSVQFTTVNRSGDSAYSGNQWSAQWTHNFNDSPLQNIEATYRHEAGYRGSSSIDSNFVFNSAYIAGNADVIHHFASKDVSASTEINGSIGGSIITANNGTVLSNNSDQGSSGVLFHLNAPKNSTLLIHSDNSQIIASPGNTFIPLSAYMTHHIYATEDPDNPTTVRFSKNSDQKLTFYPGNIIPITLNAWQTTEIYGELVTLHGKAKNAHIASTIDSAFTNSAGLFMLSVKRTSPKISVTLSNGHICYINLSHQLPGKSRAAYWIGKQECKQ